VAALLRLHKSTVSITHKRARAVIDKWLETEGQEAKGSLDRAEEEAKVFEGLQNGLGLRQIIAKYKIHSEKVLLHAETWKKLKAKEKELAVGSADQQGPRHANSKDTTIADLDLAALRKLDSALVSNLTNIVAFAVDHGSLQAKSCIHSQGPGGYCTRWKWPEKPEHLSKKFRKSKNGVGYNIPASPLFCFGCPAYEDKDSSG